MHLLFERLQRRPGPDMGAGNGRGISSGPKRGGGPTAEARPVRTVSHCSAVKCHASTSAALPSAMIVLAYAYRRAALAVASDAAAASSAADPCSGALSKAAAIETRISLTRMLTALDSRDRCPRALAARRSSAKSSQSPAMCARKACRSGGMDIGEVHALYFFSASCEGAANVQPGLRLALRRWIRERFVNDT